MPLAGTGSSGPPLPPVLLVVLCNRRRPGTAPVEMTDLVAGGERTCWRRTGRRSDTIFWTGRVWPTRICRRTNLVSALIGLEKTRDAARLRAALQALSHLEEIREMLARSKE